MSVIGQAFRQLIVCLDLRPHIARHAVLNDGSDCFPKILRDIATSMSEGENFLELIEQENWPRGDGAIAPNETTSRIVQEQPEIRRRKTYCGQILTAAAGQSCAQSFDHLTSDRRRRFVIANPNNHGQQGLLTKARHETGMYQRGFSEAGLAKQHGKRFMHHPLKQVL